MARPKLHATGVHDETFGGITYHLDGPLVPVLTVELAGTAAVYFEHHVLLWKHPGVDIGVRPVAGAIKRMLAGMQVFVTEASGKGEISFSRNGVGQIIPIHLHAGEELHVREHQFLAATANIDYTFERVGGVANTLLGGSGFFIDKFHGHQGAGVLWLHGYGNVFEKVLSDGEYIDVEPGAWLYKDPNVSMDTNITRLSTGILAGTNMVLNRFTGPGRIGLQSLSAIAKSDD